MTSSPGQDPAARLPPGTSIGPYRILDPLGRGGMGDVYRARDERLGRDVAVKVLRPGSAIDPDRVRRFEQEARAVGALNHPNLVAVFDVGRDAAGPYVVFELLEGETMRHRLASGALALRKAVGYAIQIARGLAAAHDKGIAHRDLKPDNLFITSDGRVKILDFGLAKLRGDVDPWVLGADGATVSEMTGAGAVLGTAGYMSPEQVRGLPADHRSDIFAFGVVLYEMLTGRRAFRGDSAVETMNAILKEEPPELPKVRPDISAPLDRIVRRCLGKRPEERFQSAHDMAFALEAVAPVGTDRAAAWSRRTRGMTLAVVAVVLGLVAAAGVVRFPPGDRIWNSRRNAPMRIVPLTSLSGWELQPALSADGTHLAFSWDGGGGNWDIYVQLIGAGTALRLTTNPASDESPVWSPDGRYIAFIRSATDGERGLFTVPALGGPERKLQASRCASSHGRCRLDWSPDGKWLAFQDQTSSHRFGIFLLSLETLERRRLTAPPEEHQDDAFPAFSPDGRSVAFARMGGTTRPSLNVVPVAGGEVRRVSLGDVWTAGELGGQAWAPDGGSIVASWSPAKWANGGLWRVPASGGVPEQMAVGGDNAFHPSISRRGNRLAFIQASGDMDTWEIGMSGSPPRGGSARKLIASSRLDFEAQLAPDGRKIAFTSNRSGTREIWICDRDGANALQLTRFDGSAGVPRWSADGRRIAFEGSTDGESDVYVLDVAGGRPRRLTTEASFDGQPSWSGDGRWIYFPSDRARGFQVWKVPADGGPAVQVTRNGGFLAFEAPDGRRLYYAKAGAPGIWSVPVDGGEERMVHPLPLAGYWDGWGVGRQGLYFVDVEAKPHPAFELLSFATRRVTRIAEVDTPSTETGRPAFLSISPDERSILYSRSENLGSDIVMVEGFR